MQPGSALTGLEFSGCDGGGAGGYWGHTVGAEDRAVVQVLHGMGGSARPSWRSSTRTGTPPNTTWCGGLRRSSRG